MAAGVDQALLVKEKQIDLVTRVDLGQVLLALHGKIVLKLHHDALRSPAHVHRQILAYPAGTLQIRDVLHRKGGAFRRCLHALDQAGYFFRQGIGFFRRNITQQNNGVQVRPQLIMQISGKAFLEAGGLTLAQQAVDEDDKHHGRHQDGDHPAKIV